MAAKKKSATAESPASTDGPSAASPTASETPSTAVVADPPKAPKPTLTGEAPAGELQKVKLRLAQVNGELDAALEKVSVLQAQLDTAGAENAALRGRLQSQSVSTLPELDEDAAELLESVTLSLRGSSTPGHANQGDVVTLGNAEALARRLGGKCKVFAVDQAMLDELERLSFLRRR